MSCENGMLDIVEKLVRVAEYNSRAIHSMVALQAALIDELVARGGESIETDPPQVDMSGRPIR